MNDIETHTGSLHSVGGWTGCVSLMPKSNDDGPEWKEADAVLFARCKRSPKEQMGDQHQSKTNSWSLERVLTDAGLSLVV